jgi:hypothetical protein
MMTSNPVKAGLQRVLNSVGLLERARASTLYDAYWRVADSAVLDRRAAEVTFYRILVRTRVPRPTFFSVSAPG